VTQTIATAAGQQYDLSFYLGSYTQVWGGPPISILAEAGTTAQTFSNASTTLASTWTRFDLPFTATGASTAITLIGAAGVEYIGLDNVSVDPGVAAVPEPETYALMLAGLGLVSLMHRRRRR
jgi:hypothetical protein